MEVLDGRSVVDGLATHHLEAGPPDGPTVLLLHGGAWGECARTTWTRTAADLADRGLRVLAPDWLGFGESAKVRDFEDLAGRMLTHLAAWLRSVGAGEVDAVGLSMGGSHLLRALTAGPALPVRRLVLVSAGGPPIDRSTGARLMSYDGTPASMREQVRLAVADPRWADDEAYVAARQAEATRPGAYEWFASLAVRAPWAPPPPGDTVPYERIGVPTLVLAGARDPLKPAGFAEAVAARIPGARLHLFPEAGHLPPLEAAEEFSAVLGDFLAPTPTSTVGAPALQDRSLPR
ncbi:alpha/beta fold hydrolase [Geodermatophilus sp. SYSU D00696]